LLTKNFGGSYLREDVTYSFGSVWSAFYNLDYINKNQIRFWSEREWLSEDIFFNLFACYYAKKALVINDAFYYYCLNNGSLTRTYRVDRFRKNSSMFIKMLEIASQMELGEEANMRATTTYLINVLVCLKQEVAFFYHHGLVQMFKNIKRICNDAVLRTVLNNYPIKKMPLRQAILFTCIKHNLKLIVILLVRLKRNLI
jgi:hypothetical protein